MTTGNEGGALAGGVRKVSGILEESAPLGFRWDVNLMVEETHGSVPHRSTYQGLESIFRGWNLHDSVSAFDSGGLEAIERFYAKSGNRFGYERSVPVNLLNLLSFQLIDVGRLDDASTVLLRESDIPPSSIVLDMLAAAYVKEERLDVAKNLYTLSLSSNPGNENAKEKLIEMGVDVEELVPDIIVPAELLENYTGIYQFGPNVVTVSLEGSDLSVQLNDQSPLKFFPVSESRFTIVGTDVQLEFIEGRDMSASGFRLFQNGQEQNAVRIE